MFSVGWLVQALVAQAMTPYWPTCFAPYWTGTLHQLAHDVAPVIPRWTSLLPPLPPANGYPPRLPAGTTTAALPQPMQVHAPARDLADARRTGVTGELPAAKGQPNSRGGDSPIATTAGDGSATVSTPARSLPPTKSPFSTPVYAPLPPISPIIDTPPPPMHLRARPNDSGGPAPAPAASFPVASALPPLPGPPASQPAGVSTSADMTALARVSAPLLTPSRMDALCDMSPQQRAPQTLLAGQQLPQQLQQFFPAGGPSSCAQPPSYGLPGPDVAFAPAGALAGSPGSTAWWARDAPGQRVPLSGAFPVVSFPQPFDLMRDAAPTTAPGFSALPFGDLAAAGPAAMLPRYPSVPPAVQAPPPSTSPPPPPPPPLPRAPIPCASAQATQVPSQLPPPPLFPPKAVHAHAARDGHAERPAADSTGPAAPSGGSHSVMTDGTTGSPGTGATTTGAGAVDRPPLTPSSGGFFCDEDFPAGSASLGVCETSKCEARESWEVNSGGPL